MARSESLISHRLGNLSEHRMYRDAAELVLVALAFLLYFVVRANVIDRPDLALENARHIVDAEKALGIFGEAGWQRAILDERLQRYLDLRPGAAFFTVEGPSIAGREVAGHVVLPHRWQLPS